MDEFTPPTKDTVSKDNVNKHIADYENQFSKGSAESSDIRINKSIKDYKDKHSENRDTSSDVKKKEGKREEILVNEVESRNLENLNADQWKSVNQNVEEIDKSMFNYLSYHENENDTL